MNKFVFLWITIGILFISNMFLLYLNSDTKRNVESVDINYVRGILANSYKHMQLDGSEISDSTIFYLPKKRKYDELKEPINLRTVLQGEKVVFFFLQHFVLHVLPSNYML